jgi:hypothetical protein
MDDLQLEKPSGLMENTTTEAKVVFSDVQRILNGAARRILREQLDGNSTGAFALGDVNALDHSAN